MKLTCKYWKSEAIAKIHELLTPGGIFVSSTVCIGDTMKFFKYIVPIGQFLRLMPLVKVFTTQQLVESLDRSGDFEIDYQWQPGNGKPVFVVARKAAPDSL